MQTTLNWKRYSDEKPEKDGDYIILRKTSQYGDLVDCPPTIKFFDINNGFFDGCSVHQVLYWAEITVPDVQGEISGGKK